MDSQINNLKRRVERYKEVLENTNKYRETWEKELRDSIRNQLKTLADACGLSAVVEVNEATKNLGSVALNLGSVESGLVQLLSGQIQRDLVKFNGSLAYQQLFNGKIMVSINYPQIEAYGQPMQPKVVAIYRPEELKEPFFIRHLEEFVNEITQWEDFDDDQQTNTPIGFHSGVAPKAEDAAQ
jgi:hypothetical protein